MSEGVRIVGAIDFGTTYSRWAYSYDDEFEEDPTNSFVRYWKCGQKTVEKTPTCILVGPDGVSVVAFGYDAEDRYIELAEKGEHEKYYFFTRFKMALDRMFGEKLTKDLQLEDVKKRSLPALDVFSMSIKYLLEDMVTYLNRGQDKRAPPLSIDNILLVLTVPALWKDAAKAFMREAAVKAGCVSSNVILALEPEVASLYCQLVPGDQTVDKQFMQFPVGSRFLVVDAGGGTVDVAIHEVEEDYQVKEVVLATGEGWGGTMVDEAFENFLMELFGEDVYASMRDAHYQDYTRLLRDFEDQKPNLNYSKPRKIQFHLPSSLQNILSKKFNSDFSNHVRSSKFSAGASFVNNVLVLTPSLVDSFYEVPVSKTISLIKENLSNVKAGKIRGLLMVGGFSQSKLLQDTVIEAFPQLRVMIPSESSASIVKGAVCYGHHPMSITERVLKYTYGVEVMQKFKSGVHPEDKRCVTDTGEYCKQVFSKHVEKGQVVRVGKAQAEHRYTPSDSNKHSAELKLFASSINNPKFTDDSCTCIGEVKFDLDDPDGNVNRGLWVSFTFSGPEIVVDVYDEKSGKTRTAKTNFLGPSLN